MPAEASIHLIKSAYADRRTAARDFGVSRPARTLLFARSKQVATPEQGENIADEHSESPRESDPRALLYARGSQTRPARKTQPRRASQDQGRLQEPAEYSAVRRQRQNCAGAAARPPLACGEQGGKHSERNAREEIDPPERKNFCAVTLGDLAGRYEGGCTPIGNDRNDDHGRQACDRKSLARQFYRPESKIYRTKSAQSDAAA